MSNLKIEDLSIVLVEPSVVQRKIIIGNLQAAGVTQIEGVGTGQDVLKTLAKSVPDLVISNMYAEDMTGAELVQQLRQTPELEKVPFMLISSETRFKALDPVKQAGVVAILPKPFEFADLKRALNSTLAFVEPEQLELDLDYYDVSDLRVLLVDDSALARKHISRVLTNMGIQHIETANDGSEGLKKIQDGNLYDLIVTDYNMPEMDGEALVRNVREHTHLSHIPIMMVTSDAENPRLSNVQLSGVSAICDKPFEPTNVKETLMRILSD